MEFNRVDKYKTLFLYNKSSYFDPDRWMLTQDDDCYADSLSDFIDNWKRKSAKGLLISKETNEAYKGPINESMVEVIACYKNKKGKKMIGFELVGFYEKNKTWNTSRIIVWYGGLYLSLIHI